MINKILAIILILKIKGSYLWSKLKWLFQPFSNLQEPVDLIYLFSHHAPLAAQCYGFTILILVSTCYFSTSYNWSTLLYQPLSMFTHRFRISFQQFFRILLNIDLKFMDFLLKVRNNISHWHMQNFLKLRTVIFMRGNISLKKSSITTNAIAKGLLNLLRRSIWSRYYFW